MYYKISVKRLIKNIEGQPLKNEDGIIVTEDRKVIEEREVTEGEPPVKRKIVEDVSRPFPIIPAWILAETFIVYQKIDNNAHAGYYSEKGEPFSFESHIEVFESSVVETNVAPPFSI